MAGLAGLGQAQGLLARSSPRSQVLSRSTRHHAFGRPRSRQGGASRKHLAQQACKDSTVSLRLSLKS